MPERPSLRDDLRARLAEVRAKGLERRVTLPRGIDFSSNDYLSFGSDPALWSRFAERLAAAERDGIDLAAPASRLLRGTTETHLRLEGRLAEWKGHEAALLFPSGYQANVALLSALVRPQDRVISDAQNHASLIDGLRLAGCAKRVVPHLDVAAYERALAEPHDSGRTFVVVESLYSMDGDLAPLAHLAELCARHDADLIVDDAHAAGLFGARGSGWVEEQGIERRAAAVVTTFGKALGLAGASVSGSRELIDLLINASRGLIFSTATPPLMAIAVDAALDLVQALPERRARAMALAGRLRNALQSSGLDTLASAGPSVPVVLGENSVAVATAEALQARGFDVRAVRPPTVAPGTARLRISVHADRTEAEVDALATALIEVLRLDASGREPRMLSPAGGAQLR